MPNSNLPSSRIVTYREEAAAQKRQKRVESQQNKQQERQRKVFEYQKREWPVLSKRKENFLLTLCFFIAVGYIFLSIIVGFQAAPYYTSQEQGFNLAPPTQVAMYFTILYPLYWVLWPVFIICLMWPGVNVIIAGLLYAGPIQTLFILSGVIASPYVYKISRRLMRVLPDGFEPRSR